MLCVLLAYIFLVGPEAFHAMARADVEYSQLSTLAWGQAGRIIEYQYDANGSLTSKITTEGETTVEQIVYEYNLQNRLSRVETYDDTQTLITATDYKYNPQGIRVGKIVDDAIYTDYLIDPYNHTGYAQVLEETEFDISGPTPVPLTRIQYTIGDDVISQTKSTLNGTTWTANPTQYLLYDGHGSTRQLVSPNQTVQDSYSYDAYGVMLGGNPTPATPAATNLLYTGEQFDTNAQMYYNRARYYNPSNGLFNRVDPYAGNLQDPQSLHKYLYCHNNPVNGWDPTGLFTITQLSVSMAILGAFFSITPLVISGLKNWGIKKTSKPQRVGIIYKMGALEAYMYRWDAVSIGGFKRAVQAAGHTVTYLSSPDEDQVANMLNSNDIVLILAHGSPDHYDRNNMPFAGMMLGGLSVHDSDNPLTHHSGVNVPSISPEWVTANELQGRVSNPQLELVAAVCRLGRTNRMYRAIKPQNFVGLSGDGNSVSARHCFEYVVDRLNGIDMQVASNSFRGKGAMNVINPSRDDFP